MHRTVWVGSSVLALVLASVGTVSASFSGTDLFVAMAGRQAGVFPSNWYTTVWIYNPGADTATARIYLLVRNTSNPSPPFVDVQVAAGGTTKLDNVVESLFHQQVFGALRVTCDTQKLVVTSRVYSKGAGAGEKDSAGQDFAGVPVSFAIGAGESTQILGGHQTEPLADSDYRFNFGFVETTGHPVTVKVTALDGNGQNQGSTTVQVREFSQRQMAFKDYFPSVSTENVRLAVDVTSGSGKVIAYGSGITNASQDPTTLEMQYKDSLLGIADVQHDSTLLGDGTAGAPLGLADGAVTDAKVATGIGYSKLSGAPTSLPPSGPAGGALSGAYPNPGIGNGQVVTSVNGRKDDITLAAGANTTITPSGNVLTIASAGLSLPYNGSVSLPAGTSVFSVSNSGAGTGINGSGGDAGVNGYSGAGKGVEGRTLSGTGVWGSSIDGAGVYGQGQTGVSGVATPSAQTPGAFGVVGRSADNVAVMGVLGPTNAGYRVRTLAAIEGDASPMAWPFSFGVVGNNTVGFGVVGFTDSGTGVVGSSNSGVGVKGGGTTGVRGESTSASGQGVSGVNTGGGVGVSAESNASSTGAVYAYNTGGGRGVWAYSPGGYGVEGQSNSSYGVYGYSASSYGMYCDGNGYIGGSWFGPSDARLKKNVATLTEALGRVLALRGVSFEGRREDFPGKHLGEKPQIGFIAQEVEPVLPEVVTTDPDGFKAIDYSRLTPVLVEAAKEQQAIIDQQRTELDAMKERLSRLETALAGGVGRRPPASAPQR